MGIVRLTLKNVICSIHAAYFRYESLQVSASSPSLHIREARKVEDLPTVLIGAKYTERFPEGRSRRSTTCPIILCFAGRRNMQPINRFADCQRSEYSVIELVSPIKPYCEGICESVFSRSWPRSTNAILGTVGQPRRWKLLQHAHFPRHAILDIPRFRHPSRSSG